MLTEFDASTAWSPERRARAALSALSPVPASDVTRLVAEFGAVETWATLVSQGCELALGQRAKEIEVERLIDETLRAESSFIIPGDPWWPEALQDLGHVDAVSGVGGAPIGLWLVGDADGFSGWGQAVSVVGSRACSHYGKGIATDIAFELADQNTPVVSGGAYGIDAAAHQGSLAAGGLTIAVLAGGVDVCYPRGNQPLFDQIRECGVIVSELPPGTRPSRVGFLARNRIIAALSSATVVVEAGARSGAKNTATWCAQLGRVLAAVPGPVDSVGSITPHRLVQEGVASLVTSAADVLELLEPLGVPEAESRQQVELAPQLAKLLKVLPVRTTRTVGEISARTREPVGACLTGLAELELFGLAERAAAGWRRAPKERPGQLAQP